MDVLVKANAHDEWRTVREGIGCGRNRSEHTLDVSKHNVVARYMKVVLRGCSRGDSTNFSTSLYWLQVKGR